MSRYVMPLLPFAAYWATPGCGFLDPVYESREGSLHPGADLNIRTGGDSDLGKKIYNITEGTVESARFWPVWGYIVVTRHDGPGVWTMHAHCSKLTVKRGDKLEAGDVIGYVGKGAPDKTHPNGRYWAHDHLEVRTADLAPNDWPSARLSRAKALAEIKRTRVDPMSWLKKVGALWVDDAA